jgi:hypothetical protein
MPVSVHVGFLVEKVALGQVFSEYFSFHLPMSFHRLSPLHISSGEGAIGQLEAAVQRHSLSPMT